MARWPALLALLLLALACTAHCSAGNIDDETGGSWEEQPRCQPADVSLFAQEDFAAAEGHHPQPWASCAQRACWSRLRGHCCRGWWWRRPAPVLPYPRTRLLCSMPCCSANTPTTSPDTPTSIDINPSSKQGTASFGILFGGGNDPLAPRPLDLLRLDGPAATPVANPVLTPAQLGVEEIADPILVHMGKSMTRIFMFFAARPCGGGRWGIAAAQSDDGGASWKALGFVLQDPEVDLRHPIVFGHNKHVRWPACLPSCLSG